MPCVDRTNDFFAVVDRIKASSAGSAAPQKPRAAQQNETNQQFNAMAGEIGRELHTTQMKLQELGKLAKQRGLFNDRTAQIQELTYDVKQSIDGLRTKLELLDQVAVTAARSSSHSADSNRNLVSTLKTRLFEVTREFKDVLETRTENLKKQESRRKMYSFGDAAGASSSAQPVPFGNAANLDVEGGQGQMLAVQDRGTAYHQSRVEAMENVQKMIGELATMFQKVAAMVTQQDELIRRLDEDVDRTSENVKAAENELLKYWGHMQSNRGLILKVFGVLVFFIVFFVLFLA